MNRKYDVLIIGGGIVGSSIARELAAYKLKIAVLDSASDLPSGATKANSAMIHAGYDDKPGSLKARLCAKGNKRYHELHETLDFTLREVGSYVCAFNEDDIKHLEMLLEQGKKNAVPGVAIINGDELRNKEPNASPDINFALWAPTGAIVNNFEACLAFLDNAQQNGVELYLDTGVDSLILDEKGDKVQGVRTNKGEFTAPVIINAAGVHSDEIARMAGDESFNIMPRRGDYFILDKECGRLVNSFLFACPSELGKGITVASTADFNLLVGPTSIVQDTRDSTATTEAGLREVITGSRRLVPNIPYNMAITSFAGVRADPDTGDFVLSALKRPLGFVNAAGIKSPGLTSAPAIALAIVDLIREELGNVVQLVPNPDFVPERKHIPRFFEMSMEEKERLVKEDPRYAQIVCRCETVTEGQVVDAIRKGARTVAGVKMWARAGSGRCQGGFCSPRVIDILARELGVSPQEITRHGGHSRYLVGKTKEILSGERK